MTARPALLVDLDDTLYPEEDFVRSGYSAVARHHAQRLGLSVDALLDVMWYDFRRNGRTGLFDRLLKQYPAIQANVAELVSIYRDHRPDIALWPDADTQLARLQRITDIAIVTDGNPQAQRAKIAALGLEGRVPVILLTWEFGAPKPSPEGFREAARRLGHAPEDCVIVGDDPYHDIAAAAAGGFPAIRVRTGRAGEIPTRETPPRYAEVPRFANLVDGLAQLGFVLKD